MASFYSQNLAENYAGDCAAKSVHRWSGKQMKLSNDANLLIVVKGKKTYRTCNDIWYLSDKTAEENQCQ